MRRKKQFMVAALCAFSMMIESMSVVAQSIDKKQESKSVLQHESSYNEFDFDGRVVKDSPYSAETVSETIQTLADGNRIVRTSSSKIYRDSAGRTRREQTMKEGATSVISGETPTIITIHDPVAGVHYTLDSSTRTAYKLMTLQALHPGQIRKGPRTRHGRRKLSSSRNRRRPMALKPASPSVL
jgi:hypothetical protein